MDQYIGRMLDNRYELLELIGSGGMANVYKAKCHRLNRLVAVKILKNDLANNADFRRRFRDESLAVASLSHANIVAVYDVSSSGGIEYIVMELIDGITLKQYMERRGQMDWREAMHFITQIMRGLSHAHSRGIIHRDIKPQNIMVLRDGGVKVADFGIACLADAANTLTQEALGSVHYISPEQARGDRTDARSDVYSAGVVLYEMLTGRLPFEGESAVSVAIQHLSSVPLNPREINPDIPEAMELICMKAMNPDLKKRYASADAMLGDLERFRKDPTVNLDYIRRDLTLSVDDEPTMPITTTKVASAVRKQQEQRKPEPESRHTTGAGAGKKRTGLVIGGVAVAAALIVALFTVILRSFGGDGGDGTYEVPNVLGYSLEDAQGLEEVQGVFEIRVIGSKEDENYEPGQIVSQDPGAGTIRKSNLVIQVYLCAEAEEDVMPDLLGADYQNGKIILQGLNLNLQVEKEERESDEYPAGQIMNTFPEPGMSLKKGGTVTLVVSTGPQLVTVISFKGMNVEEATRAAEELGLVVGDITYENTGSPAGQVLRQSLSVNTQVDSGTVIDFTVSGKTVKKTVQFEVPEAVAGKNSVKVDFYLDDTIVDSMYLSDPNSADPVFYEYSAPAGETHWVSVAFDGARLVEQEVIF